MREPVNPDLNMGHYPEQSDHDLLIRVDTKMDLMKTSLDEFRGTMSRAVSDLWEKKAAKDDVDVAISNHILKAGLKGDGTVISGVHARLTRIEYIVWFVNGFAVAINILLKYVKLW